MEGGVRHDVLGVVDTQEKNRLCSACTQTSGASEYRHGVCAACMECRAPSDDSWKVLRTRGIRQGLEHPRRTQVLSRAGEHRDRTCRTGTCGGKWWWRDVGTVEGCGDSV